MSASKARTVRATPAQWARIGVRADEAGMKISPFVVACALHDEAPEPDAGVCAPTQEGHRLALTAQQQSEMHEALVRTLTEPPEPEGGGAPAPAGDTPLKASVGKVVRNALLLVAERYKRAPARGAGTRTPALSHCRRTQPAGTQATTPGDPCRLL